MKKMPVGTFSFGDPGGVRTHDRPRLIKSGLLYQLSDQSFLQLEDDFSIFLFVVLVSELPSVKQTSLYIPKTTVYEYAWFLYFLVYDLPIDVQDRQSNQHKIFWSLAIARYTMSLLA